MDENVKIDPDLSPISRHNMEMARRLGFSFDAANRVYRDKEGEKVLDEFGQPLGN